MATRLVTIATFDMSPKAEMARNALTTAGIQSVLSDDNLLGMDWLLGNAIGWVKLQVREEDADLAVSVLDESLGKGGMEDSETADNLADQADSAEPVEEASSLEEKARTAVTSANTLDESEHGPTPGSREDYARRLFVTAWLGLVIPPIWFYALYLFLNAAFSEGTLTARGRFNLMVGSGVLLLGLPMTYLILAMIGTELRQ